MTFLCTARASADIHKPCCSALLQVSWNPPERSHDYRYGLSLGASTDLSGLLVQRQRCHSLPVPLAVLNHHLYQIPPRIWWISYSSSDVTHLWYWIKDIACISRLWSASLTVIGKQFLPDKVIFNGLPFNFCTIWCSIPKRFIFPLCQSIFIIKNSSKKSVGRTSPGNRNSWLVSS